MAQTDAEQAARSGSIKDVGDCLTGMCAALRIMADAEPQIIDMLNESKKSK